MNYGYLAELITTILEVKPSRGRRLAERLSLENSDTTTIRESDPYPTQIFSEVAPNPGTNK